MKQLTKSQQVKLGKLEALRNELQASLDEIRASGLRKVGTCADHANELIGQLRQVRAQILKIRDPELAARLYN